jgi:cyclase
VTGNAGIVDLGGETLVFDTFLTPQSSADLRSAAQVLTGRHPSLLANSHWHFDHAFGNAAFGGCTIHGTETTRQELGRRAPAFLATIADPTWGEITATMQAVYAEEANPAARLELAGEIVARHELKDGYGRIRVRTPDAIFTARHRFEGERGAMVVEGHGHSESDSVLFVTDDEVLFTGDLVTVGVHPTVGVVELARWRETLDKVAKIQPRVLVPGHGPATDVSACQAMQEYLLRLEQVAEGDGPVELPAEYADWAGPRRFLRSVQTIRAARDGPPVEDVDPAEGPA